MSIGELLIQSAQQMDALVAAEREQMTPARFEQLYAQEFKPDVDLMRKEQFKHTAQNQYPRPAWYERAFE